MAPDEQEIKDDPKIEVSGRKVTVIQYGASGSVAISEELMTEHGISIGSQARWFTMINADGKFLVLRPEPEG